MKIKSLRLSNFRNHKNTFIELSPGINIFWGKNAQGKTNLLEAVYLTCVGRGWRTNKDKEMINFESDFSCVHTLAAKKFGDVNIEVYIPRLGKKGIKINGISVQKMGELMGQVNCVFFSPDELRLIKDAPADRRRFLDIDISQIDKTYFYSLLRYNKILLQRNAFLKSKTQNISKTENEDVHRMLDIWDAQLAQIGAFIVFKRLEYIELLKTCTAKCHNELTGGKETITLSYINITVIQEQVLAPTTNATEIEKILINQLVNAREKDMRLKTTTVGPHRDDLLITINGKDVRNFASQGQQRTTALSLKLGEMKVFEDITGEAPVLLLDDVFSELDNERQVSLIKLLNKNQSIITMTQGEIKGAKVFQVLNGKIIKTKFCDTCHKICSDV